MGYLGIDKNSRLSHTLTGFCMFQDFKIEGWEED